MRSKHCCNYYWTVICVCILPDILTCRQTWNPVGGSNWIVTLQELLFLDTELSFRMCKKQSIYGIHTVEFRTESVLFSSRQNSMDQGCWKDDRLQENFGTVLCVYAYTPHTELCCRLWTQHYGTYFKACCTQCKAYSLAISMCTVYICVGTKFTMCQTGHCRLISQAVK